MLRLWFAPRSAQDRAQKRRSASKFTELLLFDEKSCGCQCFARVTREMTPPRARFPNRFEGVLPAPARRAARSTDVFDQQQTSVGSKDTMRFANRTLEVTHRAQDQCRDDAVKTPVSERQLLCAVGTDLRAPIERRFVKSLGQPSTHVQIGFRQHQALDLLSVVVEIATRSGAQLQDGASGRV